MKYEIECTEALTLTFTAFEKWFEKSRHKAKLNDEEKRMLHMLDDGGRFTNLAFLLSDQCDRTIKVAVYSGNNKNKFREKVQFAGSVVSQLDSAYRFIDKRGYPEYAVKEAISNAVIHRDYSLTGSTAVNVFDDRIEVVSLGGIERNLSLEAVLMGAVQPVNPYLMEVFRYLGLSENFGTGLARIQCTYSDEAEKPIFEAAEGCFRVTLPKCEIGRDAVVIREDETPPYAHAMKKIADPKGMIYDMACEKGVIVRKDVQELLGIKTTRAFDLLKEMCSDGQLRAVSKGRSSYYEIISEKKK